MIHVETNNEITIKKFSDLLNDDTKNYWDYFEYFDELVQLLKTTEDKKLKKEIVNQINEVWKIIAIA